MYKIVVLCAGYYVTVCVVVFFLRVSTRGGGGQDVW